jgi:hypothetical protein
MPQIRYYHPIGLGIANLQRGIRGRRIVVEQVDGLLVAVFVESAPRNK